MLRVRADAGVLDAKIRQMIADNKVELIKALEAREQAAQANIAAIPRSSAGQLSLFQERLWVLHKLEPESTAYNLAMLWLSDSTADTRQTAEAIARLSKRHEILRATFREEAGKPLVQLADEPEVHIVDLTALTDVEAHHKLEDDRYAASHRPFDLENETAVRWAIYRLSHGRTAVLVSAHHIVVDQWSFGILRQELTSECENVVQGRPPAETRDLQYSDYAAWQRRIYAAPEAASELNWWEKRLTGLPQFSTFPPDQFGDNPAGASRPFRWDAELTRAITTLARSRGATTYMMLLAACATVLRAHTGQTDIALGSPMGLRERPEFERIIGPFVNLLLMRLDLSDDPTFSELITRARDAVLDAHDHRLTTFESIVERVNPPRTFDRSPLFQVSVVLHEGGSGAASEIWSGGAIQDVTWYAIEVDGRLQGSLEYRTDLYHAETIDRIAAHLETVLRVAIEDPNRRISQISLLTPDERQKVLKDFNATDAIIDRTPSIVQFERQAALTPEVPAVTFGGATLTYDALNRRANRIARGLKSMGVGRGSLVGVGMKRSPDMLAALLAIAKTGGAYLPLDPAFPEERLRFMLEDSGTQVFLSDGEAAPETPAGVQVVDPKTLIEACTEELNLGEPIAPDAAAYVLYTSGSTGRPNGVVVDHAALSNFLGSMRMTPGFTSEDVMAAVTTISFDIAGLELYLPLIVGGRIELIATETAADGLALSHQIEVSGATVLQATPATWRLLLEAGWRGGPRFRAFCGGEPLPRDLADDLLGRVDQLWNLYGPTETTIWSTVENVVKGEGRITVGRPIANTQIYIVNTAGQLCPTGVPGEIWIGGAGLARGYHRREALTSERFVPDPFSSHRNARAYRTGDIGFWQSDGRLVHNGRVDQQVKVRGHRVELGEIEAALRTHPAVREAVVVARTAGDADVRLVAYLVYEGGEELTGSEARAHLRGVLPQYMLPSIYVALDSLPLTPNGKIDRRALPDPYKRAASSGSQTAPATAMERLIAKIWQDLLQVEQVGVEDNFFELGGHSLLSLRAAAAIHKETGWRMPPRTLFFQTLQQIAASVRRDEIQVESS